VQAVYVGWHPDCNMRDIESAAKAIWAGATLYVASDVPFFATKEGRSIGYSHAIVAAIRSLTGGRKTVLGKPSLHALRFVARKLGVPVKQIGVVGDDPQLETAMARRAGAVGFGVATGLTGVAAWADQPEAWRPHHVLETVGDLLKFAPLSN
jgi:ribonucleotide monophosphatase NagD (HAD superfamily)